MPADLPFAGEQRKGIREIRDRCSIFSEHIRTAIKGKSPLSYATPLPREAKEAAVSPRDANPEELVPFWDSQMDRLTTLATASEQPQHPWGRQISPERRAATEKLNTVALS